MRPVNAFWKVLPFVLYGLLFIASFYPQSLRPQDTIAYVGDSLEAVWMLGWNVQNLFRNPLDLFEANILYPSARAVTFTDHRILTSVVVAPVLWASDNPVLAYNVALALGCLLAAIAARHLALGLGIGALGSFAAGALYAFHTYQVNEGPRLHILYHGFLPLVIYHFIRHLKTGSGKDALAVGGWMLLQGLASSYHVFYGAFLLSLLGLGVLAAQPKLIARRIPALAGSAMLAGLLFSPIVLAYIESARLHGFRHELPSGVDLSHYLFTTPTNVVYGAIGDARLQQQGPHFIGFLSVGLAFFAMAQWRRNRPETGPEPLLPARIWVPIAALLAVLFILLSLGRDARVFGWNLGPGPYRLLYSYVPGFQQVRIPERLSLLAMLFIALLVGRALSVMARSRFGPVGAALAVAFVVLEHISPLPHTTTIPVREEIPAVYRWLSREPARALVEVPIPGEPLIRQETLSMYFSLYHGKPIIHGYESFPPLLTSFLRKMAMEFPSEASLEAFDRIGVDTVVMHHGLPGSDRIAQMLPKLVDSGRLRLVARFSGEAGRLYEGTKDEVYRILPLPAGTPAPRPVGVRKRGIGWQYRTKLGDPLPAADADMSTSWKVARALRGDEFYEITFDGPEVVSGLIVRLDRFSNFPTSFKIAGRDLEGQWISVAWFDEPHKLQLLEGLLRMPYPASLGFDLQGRTLTGVRIMVEEGGESFFGWSIPEIEVLVPEDSLSSEKTSFIE